MISVEYVDHMGSDLSVVNAARVSFANQKEIMDAGDVKLINYLADHKHSTPFRHTQVQIRCKAPIFVARQLGKHQAGLSWNEVSRRYVTFTPEFYTPDGWRAKPEGSIKQGSSNEKVLAMESHVCEHTLVEEVYADYINQCLVMYEDMLRAGICPEQARMVLPQSMITEWMWSGNILAFAHVYNERIAPNAQKEVQDFAEALDKVMQPLYPVSWNKLTCR